MLKLFSMAAAFTLVIASATAGQVTPAQMTGSAQMQVTAGNLDGCGLRVVAIADDASVTFTALDFSFNFYRNGQSLVKAGARMASMNLPKELKSPPIKEIVSFWVRALGQPATAPNKAGIFKSASPKGYLFYAAAAEAIAPLFGAAFEGRPVQVGFRLVGEDVDRILSGTIKGATEADLKEVSQCMGELTDAMEKDIEATRTKGN